MTRRDTRRVLVALAILAAMGLGTSSTFARPQLPELVTVARSVACNVEQQTIRWYGEFDPASPCPGPNVVNNPTECGWDIDDSWTKRGDGRLATGQVAQGSLCVVSDGTHRANVDASVRAKTDRLVVRLDASDGRAWVAVPVRDGNDFAYLACGDNYIPAPHPDLPGSNGGQGSIVTYTLTIDATERGGFVAAMLDYGSGFWTVGGC